MDRETASILEHLIWSVRDLMESVGAGTHDVMAMSRAQVEILAAGEELAVAVAGMGERG